MKNVLFVVDERCMGGVSVLLMDMFKMMDTSKMDIDLLVLHDRGDMFNELPNNVHLMFGDSYFSAIDLTLKEVIKSKNIKTLYRIIGGKIENENITLVFEPNSYRSK